MSLIAFNEFGLIIASVIFVFQMINQSFTIPFYFIFLSKIIGLTHESAVLTGLTVSTEI